MILMRNTPGNTKKGGQAFGEAQPGMQRITPYPFVRLGLIRPHPGSAARRRYPLTWPTAVKRVSVTPTYGRNLLHQGHCLDLGINLLAKRQAEKVTGLAGDAGQDA